MPHALPVFSVDTEEQARDAQVRFCRLAYDGRYLWTDFGGTLDALDGVSDTLQQWYRLKKRKAA